jgi:cytochrome c oxidase assembly factor CtaG
VNLDGALNAHAGSPAIGGVTLSLLLFTGLMYAAGARQGRQPAWSSASAAIAVVALIVALVGPLDAWATERFSAHMVQHLLLTVVAAPTMVLARPHRVLARVLPIGGRRFIGGIERRLAALRPRRRWFTWQVGAALVHAVVLWAWHAPWLYGAALDYAAVHVVEHVLLLGSAVVLWGVVIAGARSGASAGAVAALFLTSLLGMALAALLTFAATPLYAGYVAAAGDPATALADQQVAGGLMWVPGKLLPLVAAAAIVVRWLSAAEPSLGRSGGRPTPGGSPCAGGRRATAATRRTGPTVVDQ